MRKAFLRADEDQSARLPILLELMRLATESTVYLNELVTKHASEPDVRLFIDEFVSVQHLWPIPFNETEDLRKYSNLRIGYLAIPSRDPKKRTGNTIFSTYALALVLRLRVLRAKRRLKLRSIPPTEKIRLEHRIKNHEDQWRTKFFPELEGRLAPLLFLEDPLRVIAGKRFKRDRLIDRLPEFTVASAEKWRSAAVELLEDTIVCPETTGGHLVAGSGRSVARGSGTDAGTHARAILLG